MIDIAVLTCNRKRIHELALRELRKRTTTEHRLIVCDNGSEDGTPEMLDGLLHEGVIDHLVLIDENTGVHWGHNVLLEHVGTELYVSADGDLVPQSPVVTPLVAGTSLVSDWLSSLLFLSSNLELAGIEGPYGAIACRPHIMIGDHGKMFENAPPILERGFVGAHLRLMRTDIVREVGGWKKEKKPSRNNEERWIGKKLKEAGWKVGYARDIRCIHLFGREEHNEDPWGYPLDLFPEPTDHGHRDVWPPVNHFAWDRIGVNWETCQ
jgi:glycosyltransferase involved in cell wall biosynthesis